MKMGDKDLGHKDQVHGALAHVKANIQLFDFEVGFNRAARITFKGKRATEQLRGMRG